MLAFGRRFTCLVVYGLLLISPVVAMGQTADPDPARFDEAISAFDHWDTQNAFPARSVLFVGSSSIVRWATAEDFPGLPVINRGFGGSHISDVNHFIEQTVLKYDPALVVFYAGNNDIAQNKTPAQVFADYQEFVTAVHADKSDTQILFISLHPSIARWAVWPQMVETNNLIKSYSEKDPTLHYVDISAPMLGRDGKPMPQLYVEDGLHLTPAGYDIWNPIVARAIASVRTMETSRR
jgi:lysophospholipase L1-like esterase